MQSNKEKLADYIQKLPIEQNKKQELLATLDQPDGEQAVKLIIKAMLEDAALSFSAKQAILDAEVAFNSDLAEIEKQAIQLGKSVAKDLDEEATRQVRNTIS